MSNVPVSVMETLTRDYQLESSDLYNYPGERTIKALSTCPSASQIRVITAPKSSANQFNFSTTLGSNQFLSTVMKVHYRIPFNIKLAAWPVGTDSAKIDITDTNFLKQVFDDNSDICLAQGGLVQALGSYDMKLNDQTLRIVSNIPQTANMTSPYYDTDDTSEYIQASQPDRFQDFEKYSAGNVQLKYVNEFGKTSYTSISPENEQNIFASKYQEGYSTRTPQWEFISANKTTEVIKVVCSFWDYPRFGICTTPNAETAIPGVRKLDFSMNLLSNLGSLVFNMKKSAGALRYTSIEHDLADIDNTEGKLIIKVITPPSYMAVDGIDKKTGLPKPFSIGCPLIIVKPLEAYTVAAGGVMGFSHANMQLPSIPRSIYIGLIKRRVGTDARVVPINYGLVQNLTVDINSVLTDWNDQIALDYLTNSNGYDEMDQIGKLIKGYPIKLNMGKDVTLPYDTVVGAGGNFIIDIRGNFKNQGDVAATFDFVVVASFDSTLDFDGTYFTSSAGVVIPHELLSRDHFLSTLHSKMQREVNVLGAGRFADSMKWIGRNALKLAKNAWDNRETIAKTAGDVMSVVKTMRGGEDGGKLAQSNRSGGGNKNGTQTFGAGTVATTIFK